MTVKYAFLCFDEPKSGELNLPSKLFEFTIKDISDLRSEAVRLSEDIYENLKGKEKFRFYIESETGYHSVYQVNFHTESRDFFESELTDDLRTFVLTKK